jgi:hypothetical protein
MKDDVDVVLSFQSIEAWDQKEGSRQVPALLAFSPSFPCHFSSQLDFHIPKVRVYK